MSEKLYSVNERAEKVMGRRLTKEQEGKVIPFDFPCELGYWCPVCRKEWDERLYWSEYRSFLWCPTCNFDYPSALCVPLDAAPKPHAPWWIAGREAAVRVYLDTIEESVAISKQSVPAAGGVNPTKREAGP